MIHSAPLPPAAGPPSRGRRGEGTTRLREYTLWSMYALLVLWPPCLALSYARAPVYTPWTLPFLACQTAEAVACGITLHHVAAYEIEDTRYPGGAGRSWPSPPQPAPSPPSGRSHRVRPPCPIRRRS